MPRVKLNVVDKEMIAIKKRVVRANKRKYAGTDKPLPLETERITGMYNTIYEKLNAVIASIGEINAQLNLTAGINAAWASKAIDRYISATSSAKKMIADLNNYLEQHIAELGSLNDAQVTQLSASQQELTDTFKDIVANVNKLTPKQQIAIKKVFRVFVDDLVKLNELLQGNIGFKRTTTPLPVEALAPVVLPHPEQQVESSPEKARKKRSDAGTKRPKKPTPAPTLSLQQPAASGDSESEGGGYGGCCCDRIIGGAYGDRIIGGGFLRKRLPMLFPAAEVPEGAYLETAPYMPTRFL